MGLIQMAVGSVSTQFKDQVVDIFECTGMSSKVLGCPGQKVLRSGTVNNATDNVISNGSVFNVSINQAAILVEDGKVHDFVIATSNELAGQYRYDSEAAPSLLGGGFKDFLPSLKDMLDRFTAGGQSKHVMRLYYINCQILTGLPVGFGAITFRDGETGVNLKAQAHGTYELQIVNPVGFYENYVKTVTNNFTIDSEEGQRFIKQIKSEMAPAFQRALGTLSQQGIRYEQLGYYSLDITDLINKTLVDRFQMEKGIILKNLNLEITFDEESEKQILAIQRDRNYQSDTMLRAHMGLGFSDAAGTAAANENGAMQGIMGLGMMGNMMGNMMGSYGFNGQMNPQQYNPNTQPTVMANMNPQMQGQPQMQAQPQVQPQQPVQTPTADAGAVPYPTAPAPAPVADDDPNFWTCSCGTKNKGKFCQECGSQKPAGAPLYRCDKCGWEPEDPKNPPKFCPECGDKFDDGDIVK